MVVRAVKYRTDQLRESGVATGNQIAVIVLQGIDLNQQITGFGNHVFAGFETQFEFTAVFVAEFGKEAGDFRAHFHVVDPFFVRFVGDFEAAAEVEEAQVGEIFGRGDAHQRLHALVHGFVLNTRTGVLVEPDDFQVVFRRQFPDFVHLVEQDAEFGDIAGGHQAFIFAVTDVRIEAQAEFAAGKRLAELGEAGDRTDIHQHALFVNHVHFGFGQVVCGVDDAFARESGFQPQDHFARRYGIQIRARLVQQFQDA